MELNRDGLPPKYPFQPDWEITPRQVRQMLDSGQEFLLVDCRTPGEYERARIAGAKLMPLQQLSEHAAELEEWADKPIVVHCHLGGRSLKMTALLRQHGFANIKSMAGGIDLWSIDIDPSIPRY